VVEKIPLDIWSRQRLAVEGGGVEAEVGADLHGRDEASKEREKACEGHRGCRIAMSIGMDCSVDLQRASRKQSYKI
jgi:hypothetical protein